MGMLRPRVKTQQPVSIGTPLAKDFISALQESLRAGGLGTPVGPVAAKTSAALDEFIRQRSDPSNFLATVEPLKELFDRETERGIAALRESMGMMGQRFGTPLAKEEANLRLERNNQLNSMINELFRQEQANLLSALGLQKSLADSGIEPYLQVALGSNFPSIFSVVDSPIISLLKTLTPLGLLATILRGK